MDYYLTARVEAASDEVFEHGRRLLRRAGLHQETGDTGLISRYAAE
jgi:hypothetical protein